MKLILLYYTKSDWNKFNDILYKIGLYWLIINKNWKLKKCYYSTLQNLNKTKTYLKNQVKVLYLLFTRLNNENKLDNHIQKKYQDINFKFLIFRKDLKTTIDGIISYFNNLNNKAKISKNISTDILLVYRFNNNYDVIKYFILRNHKSLKVKINAIVNQYKKMVVV